MGSIGFQEILLIAGVEFLLLGSKKISGIMKGLGKGIREFNDAKTDVEKEPDDNLVIKNIQSETIPPAA